MLQPECSEESAVVEWCPKREKRLSYVHMSLQKEKLTPFTGMEPQIPPRTVITAGYTVLVAMLRIVQSFEISLQGGEKNRT